MFGSNPKTSSENAPSNGTQQPDNISAPAGTRTVLSSGVSIKGEVTFGSELVIDGEVEGNITSTGRLTVGTHAKVIGEIQAGFVTIQGSVQGNVRATERCALEAGANLQGDVESPRLAVDENASFIGSATITAKRSVGPKS
jgi:cytoskeletal protein CcmA (bactofilin family)